MYYLYAPSALALLVILTIWLRSLVTSEPKPMLEQIADARRMSRWESFYSRMLEDDKAYWKARQAREQAKNF